MGGRPTRTDHPAVSRADRLSAEQERDLVIGAEGGDPAACRALVGAFLPEIVALSRAFRSVTAVERQDLVQEGVAGLLLAAQRFDPALGTPFWGYAAFWVRKAMQELVATVAGSAGALGPGGARAGCRASGPA